MLLIVIPPHKKYPGQKKYQLEDLQRKIKSSIKLERSQLKDFAICQISDFKETWKKMIDESGNKRIKALASLD